MPKLFGMTGTSLVDSFVGALVGSSELSFLVGDGFADLLSVGFGLLDSLWLGEELGEAFPPFWLRVMMA